MAREFYTYTLPNGIRGIHKRTNRPVSHCGIAINAGSRDELDHEQGLAHFIEHCIFKGTKKRKTFHILSRLDAVGGEINAYTTKEETWVYASFLNHHFERAVELLADITFQSTFPEKEIQKEKDVIIDEINSYLDSPGEMIFDEFEHMVFAGHPLGRSILGTEPSVKSFGRENIFDMMDRRYRMDQIVFSSVGNMSLKEAKFLANKHLGSFASATTTSKRQAFSDYIPKSEELVKDTFQVHYIIGGQAYGSSHPNKLGLVLLNNYLGGPAMNSRLNLMIREKYGFTYNIESHYSPYSETGLMQVYLGTDKKFFERSRKLVLKELQALRDKRMGPTQLHNAKQQL
ncbi:MAG: insulinase family protein, partial [Flavobacteriales bacterium]|nr:insulinase family protein [Flavobacteriales bacterium]